MNTKAEDYYYAVIKSAMKLPRVKINREAYLREALSNKVKPQVIEEAVKTNPANAGISIKKIDKIAKSAIRAETTRVTAISAAAGAPGGFAMVGTLPADLVQYFGHVIRLQQKLVYLYGWKELSDSDESFDEKSMEQLTLFLGVMFGVKSAGDAVVQTVKVAAPKADKDVASPKLSKGVVYPVIAKVATKLGYKMSKQILARGLSKAVPVVGAFASGGVTYTAFKPLSKRLQMFLKQLPIADPKFYQNRDHYTFNEATIKYVDFDD